MAAEILTFLNKPVEKMTYTELKRERTIQLWFAKRMVRLQTLCGYGVYKRKEQCEELYNLEETQRLLDAGEIDAEEYKRRNKNWKIRQTYIHKTEDEIEFCHMMEENARAIIAIIDEQLKIKPKPPNRKGKYTPYKKMPHEIRARNRMRDDRRYKKQEYTRHAMKRWEIRLDKKGLGSLWDRERFTLICSDRGYVAESAIKVMVAQSLNIQIRQASILLKTGAFTWGQVLVLGAKLYMSPKEFCDTFLAGYFNEITDGVFEADIEKVPNYLEMTDK